MAHVRLFLSSEAVFQITEQIGKTALLEIRDLNAARSADGGARSFTDDVVRCEEIERRLHFLREQVLEHGGGAASAAGGTESKPAPGAPQGRLSSALDEADAETAKLYADVGRSSEMAATLGEQYRQLSEREMTMRAVRAYLSDQPGIGAAQMMGGDAGGGLEAGGGAGSRAATPALSASLLADSIQRDAQPAGTVWMLCGTIAESRVRTFEKVLFRASRGNVVARFLPLDPLELAGAEADDVAKSAFVILFPGNEMMRKVRAVCSAFSADIIEYPANGEVEEQIAAARQQAVECGLVLSTTVKERAVVLAATSRHLGHWTHTVSDAKSVFHAMNKFDVAVSRQCFIAEGWCPSSSVHELEQLLSRLAANSAVDTINAQSFCQVMRNPPLLNNPCPTHFVTNKFTAPCQAIINAYGIPRYQEHNPAPYTIVTFPFLFAVMFGDVGHALVLLAAALVLINKHEALSKQGGDTLQMILGGRFLLLSMACFSMYTGFIYNEFFGLPMDIFGTGWAYAADATMAGGIKECAGLEDCDTPPVDPYPVGLDPIWKWAENSLLFTNSLKMKMSVTIGIVQMIFGIVLQATNAVHFGEWEDLFFGAIPRLLFLLSIFGYMIFLIFYKYSLSWSLPSRGPSLAPDIKTILLGMVMEPGLDNPDFTLFPNMAWYQLGLIIVAVLSVPLMLLPKPFILRARAEKRALRRLAVRNGSAAAKQTAAKSSAADADAEQDEEEEEFDFGEVAIHQLIESIEFLLGCVSNTASYLRLWALSLAHGQLTDVFYEKVLLDTVDVYAATLIEQGNLVLAGLLIMLACTVWMFLSLAIIVLMESLSAFLHALRLHWVEFQNKFFHGDGSLFSPLDLRS